jgi:hypothetical protein
MSTSAISTAEAAARIGQGQTQSSHAVIFLRDKPPRYKRYQEILTDGEYASYVHQLQRALDAP